MSVPSNFSDAKSESLVLKKVTSLTLDKLALEKVTKPKFVPEKLDFALYEKFEGKFLTQTLMVCCFNNLTAQIEYGGPTV